LSGDSITKSKSGGSSGQIASGGSSGSGGSSSQSASGGSSTQSSSGYWLENIEHGTLEGYSYEVFRNVKSWGAKGDGVTDDTDAIIKAMTWLGVDNSSLRPSAEYPATIYFPEGAYKVSRPLPLATYCTEMIGNNATIKVGPDFAGGLGVIESASSSENIYKTVRGLTIDMTGYKSSNGLSGIHWSASKGCSIRNVQIICGLAIQNNQGILIDKSGGGFLSDISIAGGVVGLNVGGQQMTCRNISVKDATTGIRFEQGYIWSLIDVSIKNCSVGISIGKNSGMVSVLDSEIVSCAIGIDAEYSTFDSMQSAGFFMENVKLVGSTIKTLDGPVKTVSSENFEFGKVIQDGVISTHAGNAIETPNRPTDLVRGDKYFTLPRPDFGKNKNIVNAATEGCKGDNATDNTALLQLAISKAQKLGATLFLPYGRYLVKGTVSVPAGLYVCGEAFTQIVADGSSSAFNNESSPTPMMLITGPAFLADLVFSVKGSALGCVLVRWEGSAGGAMWDCHARIGGDTVYGMTCPKSPVACGGVFMGLHLRTGCYVENFWNWNADHDLNQNQVSILSGRGIMVESTKKPVWLIGTASEHFRLYNYCFYKSGPVFASMVQAETAYFLPASTDLKIGTWIGDQTCTSTYALSIQECSNINIYGAGLYSFFSDYLLTCATQDSPHCQENLIFTDDSWDCSSIKCLYAIGSTYMVNSDHEWSKANQLLAKGGGSAFIAARQTSRKRKRCSWFLVILFACLIGLCLVSLAVVAWV